MQKKSNPNATTSAHKAGSSTWVPCLWLDPVTSCQPSLLLASPRSASASCLYSKGRERGRLLLKMYKPELCCYLGSDCLLGDPVPSSLCLSTDLPNAGSALRGSSFLPPVVHVLLTVVMFPYVSPLASPAHLPAPGRLTLEMRSVQIDSLLPWGLEKFYQFQPSNRNCQAQQNRQAGWQQQKGVSVYWFEGKLNIDSKCLLVQQRMLSCSVAASFDYCYQHYQLRLQW